MATETSYEGSYIFIGSLENVNSFLHNSQRQSSLTQTTGNLKNNIAVPCNLGQVSRLYIIEIQFHFILLTIACSDGVYGQNCAITCGNCASGEACNHIDGMCPSGCEPGWEGGLCIQGIIIIIYRSTFHSKLRIKIYNTKLIFQ